MGALSYIVNKKGAQKLVEQMDYKRPIDVDFQFIWENTLNIAHVAAPIDLLALTRFDSTITRTKKPRLKAYYYKLRLSLARMRHNIKRWGVIKAIYYHNVYYKHKFKRKYNES